MIACGGTGFESMVGVIVEAWHDNGCVLYSMISSLVWPFSSINKR